MWNTMKAAIAGKEKKLVFPEGDDARIQAAAVRLLADGLGLPVLLGKRAGIEKTARENQFDLTGIALIEPEGSPWFDEMAESLALLRKGKMTHEECREALRKRNYFGTMMVKAGHADALLGGATYSTADTLRPALQIVKTKPESSIVSSCMVLTRPGEDGDECYVMADCALNIDPTAEELAEIATESAAMARRFGLAPRVALLSYGTKGSAKGAAPEKMKLVGERLQQNGAGFPVDGELQFDAAFVPEVARQKAPASPVAGQANVFIFPELNSANIAHKMAQRFGGFEALGPIMMGLGAPINDLSRGTNAEEVYKMAIITLAMT